MVAIDTRLVKRLVESQFPQWSHLPIYPVARGGNDNWTFHLGSEMSIRLPSADRYAPQVGKENLWLPVLAQHLHLPIPRTLAQGKASAEYPWDWSIYRWIDGEIASKEKINDLGQFANDLAQFLKELQSIDCSGGPEAGAHNFYRGGSLSIYDQETRRIVGKLGHIFNQTLLLQIWNKALDSCWSQGSVWVHGDLVPSNLLVDGGGRLSAVIDFGLLGTGDPACDLAIALTFFDEASRLVFKEAIDLDEDTWNRARGWALWKTLITFANCKNDDNEFFLETKRIIHTICAL